MTIKNNLLILFIISTTIFANEATNKKIEMLQKQINALQSQLLEIKQEATASSIPVKTKAAIKKSQHAKKRSFRRKQSKNLQFYAKPVTTSAIWGVISEYDGSDLIVSYSSMNQDLMLLKHRAKGYWRNGKNNINSPSIQLSGALEAQASFEKFTDSTNSDINLSTFELDVLAEINPWVSALASINYNDSATAELDRTKHSSLYLKRAFITLGKLKKSKLYSTVGQLYMPFGRYSSLMLTSPIVVSMGRTTGRGAILGYYGIDTNNNGLNGSIYLMQAKTSTSKNINKLNDFGLNANWTHNYSDTNNIQIGSSWTHNLADSDHIRVVLNDADALHKLNKSLSGINFYTIIGIKDWRLGAEYTSALNNLIADSVDYDRFSSIHLEIDKAFGSTAIPSNLFLSYDQSWNAQSIQLPKNSWSVGAYSHLWKNTLQALEFRHNNNYENNSDLINKNILLMQFGVYF